MTLKGLHNICCFCH